MNNFSPLLGSFILSYIIYRRLFKARLPKEICYTDDLTLVFLNCLVLISSIVILLVTIYNYYKIITNNNYKPITNRLMIKLQMLYNHPNNPLHFWTNSLIALDIAIKNKIPYYDQNRDYLDIILIFISKYFCKYQRMSINILLLINILMQSIVVACFFTDIVINHKFFYFYKVLWLLIFPLIISYLLYSIKVFININLASLDDILTLRIIKSSNYTKDSFPNEFILVTISEWMEISKSSKENEFLCINTLSEDFLIKNPHHDHANQAVILEYCVDSLNTFFKISSFLISYEKKKNMILLPFNIIKYSFYSYCWTYIIYLII